MEKKTELAKQAFIGGDVKQALKLASGFKLGLTKEDQSILKRGYECLVNPGFYVQLGKDPQVCIESAKVLFAQKWMH